MGVDFYLQRVKRKKIPNSQVELPEIEAHFAFTEYPRFLRQLAHDAGLGDAWEAYRQAGSEWAEKLADRIFATYSPSSHVRARHKKERRKQRSKHGKTQPVDALETDPDIQALQQRIDHAEAAIRQLADSEPLVELLLASTDDAALSSDKCRRLAPRLREIAKTWEPAPQGWVGWREHALEIADAMELAGHHSDVVLRIAG